MTINITKKMASEASHKMSDIAYEEKIKSKEKELTEVLDEIVKKYIPSPVIAVANEYKTYFCVYEYASVTAVNKTGYRESYVGGKISYSVPSSCNHIAADRDDYDKVLSKYNEVSKLESERNKFCEKIYNALLSLKTYKRVQEYLPFAVKYIELPSSAMAVAPVYTELNDMIKNMVK